MDTGGTGAVKWIQGGFMMPKTSMTIQRGTIYRSASGSPYERTEAREVVIQLGRLRGNSRRQSSSPSHAREHASGWR